MRWLLLIVLIFWTICCLAQGYDQCQVLATYYGISKDTVKTYFRFKDSVTVFTAGLDFVQFNDLRDTSANEKYQLCGVICHNQLTGNNTVCGIRRKTMLYDAYRVRDAFRSEEIVRLPDTKYLRRNRQYYDTFFSKGRRMQAVDVFADRNRGIALKLSSIFNELPIDIKAKLTRSVVDSICQSFIGCYEFLIDKALLMDKAWLVDSYGGIFKDYFSMIEKEGKERKRRFVTANQASGLIRFYKSHLNKNTSFLYTTWSKVLHGDGFVLVVVNSNLPASFSHLDFYANYNYEPIMFDIQIYSENMVKNLSGERDY